MILHHWDTDGIASAAIYIKMFGEDELFTPTIGNYFLSSVDFNKVSMSKKLVILDMNLPDAEKLCNYVDVYIYDHHRASSVACAKEHYNPYINGKNYPSCTTVLKERFSYNSDYLVALGIVGDTGPNARQLKEWKIVRKVMEKSRFDFRTLMRITQLIDSSYKLNKRQEVVDNVHLLLQGMQAVLESEHLNRNMDVLEKEIDSWVSKAEDYGNYFFLRMQSEYHIISSVTRKLVWELGKSAIVVNEKIDRDEFYIRSQNPEFNAAPIIELAKQNGFRAGGKKEVMGAVLPKGKGLEFAKAVLEQIGWQTAHLS